jgi:hypothetical protein
VPSRPIRSLVYGCSVPLAVAVGPSWNGGATTTPSLVLSTMAFSSSRSACGTWNLSSVCWKSSIKACHSTRVLLGATGRPADHLGHQELEPCRCHAMVGFVDARVGVQPGIDHDPIDEVIDHGGDVVHATQAVIQRGHLRSLHATPLSRSEYEVTETAPSPSLATMTKASQCR